MHPPEGFRFNVALSARHRLVAWGCDSGRVRVHTIPRNELKCSFTTDTGYSGHLAFSPDGNLLAVQTSDTRQRSGRYIIIDLDNSRIQAAFSTPSVNTRAGAISARNEYFAQLTDDNKIFISKFLNNTLSRLGDDDGDLRFAMVLSRDGNLLVTGGGRNDEWKSVVGRGPSVHSVTNGFRSTTPERIRGRIEIWDVERGTLLGSRVFQD